MILPQLFLPLFAGAGDIIGLLVFVLLVVIGLVSKLIESMNQGNQQKNRFPQQRPQQGNRDVLQQEIDRFRNERQQQPVQGRGGNVDFSRPVQARHEPLLIEPIAEAEIVHQPIGASVVGEANQFNSQIQQTFDHEVGDLKAGNASSFRSSLSTGMPVGGGVPGEAEAIASALVGSNDRRETQSALASDILNLLRTPQGVRQAVILSEIFQRPEDRWR